MIFESRRGLILIEKSLKRELEKAKTFYLYLYIGCVCKSEKNAIGKNLKVQSKSWFWFWFFLDWWKWVIKVDEKLSQSKNHLYFKKCDRSRKNTSIIKRLDLDLEKITLGPKRVAEIFKSCLIFKSSAKIKKPLSIKNHQIL